MRVPEFDKLYAVSDLHLGGESGFQIFSQGKLFKQAISRLRDDTEADAKVALVLNGDLVDFLAEKPYHYFSTDSVEKKLERIFNDPNFVPVWSSLQTFVEVKNNFLVINTGNHDAELGLPVAQQLLIDKLTKGSQSSCNKIEIIADGSGYLCRVGGAKILCIHGNEKDTWNLINYKHLRQITSQLKRGLVPRKWDANLGTRLVVDVINPLKKDYPFVDVLKPEREAVIPLLTLFVDKPQLIKSLCRIIGVAGAGPFSGIKQRTGMLDMENELIKNASASDLSIASPDVLDFLIDHSVPQDILVRAYKNVMSSSDFNEEYYDEEELLSPFGSIMTSLILGFDRFFRLPKEDSIDLIRQKLVKTYQNDWNYNVKFEDDEFKKIDKAVGEDIDCIIAGHTHLRRALYRSRKGVYFNTGTWAGLIEICPETLADKQKFYQLVQKLLQNRKSMEEYGPLLSWKPTMVRVQKNNVGVVGELLNITDNGSLDIIPETEPFQLDQ